MRAFEYGTICHCISHSITKHYLSFSSPLFPPLSFFYLFYLFITSIYLIVSSLPHLLRFSCHLLPSLSFPPSLPLFFSYHFFLPFILISSPLPNSLLFLPSLHPFSPVHSLHFFFSSTLPNLFSPVPFLPPFTLFSPLLCIPSRAPVPLQLLRITSSCFL